MNYHGTWIHAGNYSRILLVGDIFTNSIVTALQRRCPHPVDVVYADTADELLELAQIQMARLSYSLVILCSGDIIGAGIPEEILSDLRGTHAKTVFVLATSPPDWLRSDKYRKNTNNSCELNKQYRQCAAAHGLPCLDYEAIAQRYNLQEEKSATYPAQFFQRTELKRFHFSKIKKIKKEGATPAGRAKLTIRFLAFKTADFIRELMNGFPQGDVLWNNFQAEDNSPYLLIGDSNMRRIRSMNKELRSKSDIYSTSEDLLSDTALENIRRCIKPHHRAVAISYGTHHLSACYSGQFEQRLCRLFQTSQNSFTVVIAINVTQRATESKLYRPNDKLNKIIEELNSRFESVASECGIPCIDAYALMASCTFEDKVHYRHEDYTELSAQVLQHMQNGLR